VPQLHPLRIWGTFSICGGAGASTTAFYLAMAAKNLGVKSILIEGDAFSRRNTQFQKQERNWKSYENLEIKIPTNAYPTALASGITYLSFTETTENSSRSVSHLLEGAREEFELIIIDLPRHFSEFTNLLLSKLTLLNLIGFSGIESVKTFERLKNSSLDMTVSNLFLRTSRTSNLSAEESSYQMGFNSFETLPESESVKNYETYGVLPSAKDGLLRNLQNFVSRNL
jgi:cellulose biosynthesis protein BcsQ